MSGPRYAALARRLLVRRDIETPPAPPDGRERARSIAAIEVAIEAAGRRKRLRRAGMGAAAVAAAVACAAGGARFVLRAPASATSSAAPEARDVQIVAHASAGGASLMVSGAQAPLVDGKAVASGSRIVTPANGQATLSFSTGTTAALGAGSDMSVVEEPGSQMLRLMGGSIDLHVAKLAAGQRFLVDTTDSEVEVRGTMFRVEVVDARASCGGGIVTRVAVSEGVVVVRHAGTESRVAAGETWPAGCVASADAAARLSDASAPGHAPRGAHASANASPGRASDLAGQNDLFADGKRAWHRGDAAAALGAFDQLLARYPGGPLAESAFVERMRVLRSMAPESARAAARDYLARYPGGYARPEAEALLSPASP